MAHQLIQHDFDCAISEINSPAFKAFHQGKVRSLYTLANNRIALVASDRISAFDFILPRPIPYKGQMLSKIAARNFEWVQDICSVWLEDTPHPNISVGRKCEVIPIEVVVRGYLTGHAWRTYKAGSRELCGVKLPEGMKEHQAFAQPIITPATKAAEGHDEDISEQEILNQKIVGPKLWEEIRETALALFRRGQQKARENGLLLVDTKYEFGLWTDGSPVLIDEVHTPDSSRYFYANTYDELFEKGEPQKQLSKEFVREWLISRNFMGRESDQMPEMSDKQVQHIFDRYAELYQQLMGEVFNPQSTADFSNILTKSLLAYS